MEYLQAFRRTFRGLWALLVRLSGRPGPFGGSQSYWEQRYRHGGDSGPGSYGKFATFKADFLNTFVARESIHSVIEFGCGDGNQLTLAKYPRYLGFDVSEAALARCRQRFANRPEMRFASLQDYRGETAELALSLDVVFHLVEDDVFEDYMRRLFASAARFVIIYSSDHDAPWNGSHVRHRAFSSWVAANLPGWERLQHVRNRYPYGGDYQEGSFSDFHIFTSAARARHETPWYPTAPPRGARQPSPGAG